MGLEYTRVHRCTLVYSSVLWCTLVYSSVLQCTPVYSSVLQCTPVYSCVLQCTPVYSSVLRCTLVSEGKKRPLGLSQPLQNAWKLFKMIAIIVALLLRWIIQFLRLMPPCRKSKTKRTCLLSKKALKTIGGQ